MKNENKKIARLIKQIQKGNQSAFEEFYKLTSPKAYFLALKITQSEHDAEDILQESYLKAFEKISEIDTTQNVTSWFLKIVSNKSKDLMKSKSRFVFDGGEDGVFDEMPEEKTEFCPQDNLDREELRLEVMAAIDELTDEKRACIMMMYFGEMSVKEIAESIEVPESTVKNRLYTARKDLKNKFEKSGNVLYGAALGGVIIWALQKTSVTASAAFVASAASAEILAGASAGSAAAGTGAVAGASATTATAATATTAAGSATASTAASAGGAIAAKVAAFSVAQKVAVGITATAILGGSTAGVVTVVKTVTEKEPTTVYREEVTTAVVPSTEFVFNELTFPVIITETSLSTTETTGEQSTVASVESTSAQEHTTLPETTAQATTAANAYTTTQRATTQRATTTRRETTTRRPTTARPTTTKPTTTRPTTTRPTTTKPTTTRPTTTRPVTTLPTTTRPATTVPTTQAKAMLSIDIIDFDGSVIDTINIEVEAGTTLSREYVVTAVKSNGYEPMAGVYGDIGAVAQGGKIYKFEAEL